MPDEPIRLSDVRAGYGCTRCSQAFEFYVDYFQHKCPQAIPTDTEMLDWLLRASEQYFVARYVSGQLVLTSERSYIIAAMRAETGKEGE